MNTRVSIKSNTLTPFGGIFYAFDEFSHLGLSSLMDRFLGFRSSTIGYQYSEIISSLFWIYYCGGDYIEDIGTHLGSHVELRPNTRIPSPDTLLRGIKELSEDNISFRSKQGLEYSFNKAERLGALLLELLLHIGQLVKGQLYDLDFDHQFIPTEEIRHRLLLQEGKRVFSRHSYHWWFDCGIGEQGRLSGSKQEGGGYLHSIPASLMIDRGKHKQTHIEGMKPSLNNGERGDCASM